MFNSYFDLDNRESRFLEETWILNERRARVEALVAQLAPEHTPRLPVLNDVLGLGIPENDLTQSFDANLRQQNVSLILTALLHAWAVERPFVLILEDAHWLDGLAGQLALDVARALATARAPFLFVLVNRPLDANRAGQKIFDALRALDITQSLTLSALAPNEIIALIADRLNVPASVLPAPLIALVQSRANGKPFVAEELVFNLRDNGIIIQRGARIMLAQDLTQSTQTLSDTLHGLILSRIDRLPPQRQFVIKVAAVIGRAFAFAPLHHVVNQYVTMVNDSLKDHLVALTHADFTFLETLEPELTYLFKHIITQEAAYQTLLFSQRRELHRLVAEWYAGNQQSTADSESSYTVYYPLLAYHYRYAEDLAKEKQYLGLAANAAEKIFANDAAIGFYTRWLDILANEAKPSPLQVSEMALSREPATWLRSAQDALLAMTRLKRGKRFESVGRWNDAEQDYRAALSIASHNQDARLQTHGYFTLGDLERQRARYVSARDHLTRALTLAESTGARDWQAHSLIALGKILGEQGDYVRAQEHFVQALELERALGDARGEANALHALGNIAIFRAEYACAAEYYSQASVIFRALGARADEGNTLNNLGTIALYRGEYDRAANFYADALARARETGARRNESNALGNLGIVAHYQADYARAITYAEQALAIDRAIGHQQGVGRKLNALGESARAQGDYARAQTY